MKTEHELTQTERAILQDCRHVAGRYKMRGKLSDEEVATYTAIGGLFERGLLNPAGRLKGGYSLFRVTPKGEAALSSP